MAQRAAPPRRLGRRPVLDGLRGVAVLLVISEHTGLIGHGFIGVDVFFVLSGFLITTLLLEEAERRGAISLRGFYARRARRLLPPLALLGVLTLAVDLLAYRLTGWGIGLKLVSTAGFVNNWVAALNLDHGQALGALNPTWSLAQEEQFYLLWPLALILLLRLGWGPRRLLGVLVLLIGALLLLAPPFVAGLPGFDAYFSPFDRGAELLLGCVGSLLWRYRIVEVHAGRRLTELVMLGLLGAFLWLLLGADPASPRGVYLAAAALTLPALILLVEVPDTLVGRFVGARPLRAVGRISYCLYLIHLLLRNLLVHALGPLPAPEVFGLTLAVALPLAALSDRFIETPIRTGAWAARRARRQAGLGPSGPGRERRRPLPAHRPRTSPIRSSA
jgi:peptidoglycan/LPS O-acetylase OafA/YrhL